MVKDDAIEHVVFLLKSWWQTYYIVSVGAMEAILGSGGGGFVVQSILFAIASSCLMSMLIMSQVAAFPWDKGASLAENLPRKTVAKRNSWFPSRYDFHGVDPK